MSEIPRISVVVICGEPDPGKENQVPDLTLQTLDPGLFEVIYVDSQKIIARQRQVEALEAGDGGRGRFRYEPAENPSRAHGRNRGVTAARFPLIYFLGDDFQPHPEILEKHWQFHQAHPEVEACGLGPAFYADHRSSLSPFMRWLDDSGTLFGARFVGAKTLPPDFFYVSNTSLKKELLTRAGPSDENFPDDAWDDYELGVRLFREGLTVHYLPEAWVNHVHVVRRKDRIKSMEKAGEAAVIFETKYAGSQPWHSLVRQPRGWLAVRAEFFRCAHAVSRMQSLQKKHFDFMLKAVFAKSYHRTRRRRRASAPLPPPGQKPLVSFIIATFNKRELTRECLRTLQETLPPALAYEILVVDDASTDGSAALLGSLGSLVQVQLNVERRGFARNNNAAARNALGHWLCFLNNDTVLQPGWWEPMAEGMTRLPHVGMIGNIQIRPSTGHLDHRGVGFTYRGEPYNVGGSRYWLRLTRFREWPAVTAACCVLNKEVFWSAGGFDEGYVNGFEDIDLCLNLRRLGYRCYVANRSVIHHHVSSSPGRFDRETENLNRFVTRWGAFAQWDCPWWELGPGRLALTFSQSPEFLKSLRYATKHWFRPWRYNGPKLWRALTTIFRELV